MFNKEATISKVLLSNCSGSRWEIDTILCGDGYDGTDDLRMKRV